MNSVFKELSDLLWCTEAAKNAALFTASVLHFNKYNNRFSGLLNVIYFTTNPSSYFRSSFVLNGFHGR